MSQGWLQVSPLCVRTQGLIVEGWRLAHPLPRGVYGVPTSLLKANSWIGRSLHVPTFAVFLWLLLQCAQALPNPSPFSDAREVELRAKVSCSVWQSGRVCSLPGYMNSRAVVKDMANMLAKYSVPTSVWCKIERGLAKVNLEATQAFWASQVIRGESSLELAPWATLRQDRSLLHAGFNGQRHAGDSKKGLDHAIPPGIGCETHILMSGQSKSPIQPMA